MIAILPRQVAHGDGSIRADIDFLADRTVDSSNAQKTGDRIAHIIKVTIGCQRTQSDRGALGPG